MFRMDRDLTGPRIQALTSFGDDGSQLLALEELNQTLSLGQQGEVRVSAYVPALVRIIERADGNPQMVLMAVRALVQILDIEPRAGALAVNERVLPALCDRLLSISDLDVAEQCVKCLNVLSASHARDVLHAGGLKAVTTFFDFFPQHLQRRAAETAAVLCGDAARQSEDAVHILEALPYLNVCLDSPDERVLQSAVQCFTRLVSCYGSTGTIGSKHALGHPSMEMIKVLQHYSSASRSKDPKKEYVDLDMSSFQPKYSPQWRKQVLTVIGTSKVVARILAMAKKKPSGEENHHLLSALARFCRWCPHLIPTLIDEGLLDVLKTKLSASGSSKSGEALTNALRLIQALLPPVPHSKSFDRKESGELCDPAKYDASLVLGEEDMEAAKHRRDQLQEKVLATDAAMSAGGEANGASASEAEGESFWACSLCTYHNAKGVASCEMCGQVSPEISERASRLEVGGMTGSREKNDEDLSSSDTLEQLVSTWEDRTLGIRSCSQLYKEQPHLLEPIAKEIMPDLTQVAAKAANPDHRTRALGALASLLYCAPRSLLETVAQMFGPGGPHYVGLVHAGLQSQNPHVVASVLRVAMVELWRLGITSGLQREGIPQLVRGLGTRFHEPNAGLVSTSAAGDKDRVMSLRRRAAAWIAEFEYQSESEVMQDENGGRFGEQSVSKALHELRNIAQRLESLDQPQELESLSKGLQRKVSISPKPPLEDQTPPCKKRRRMTAHGSSNGITSPPHLYALSQQTPTVASNSMIGNSGNDYYDILRDLNELLRKGVVSSEFQNSGVAQAMASLANSRPEFVHALQEVFADEASMTSLVRTLHDALDGAEKFSVIKYGQNPIDSFRAMKSHFRIVLQPSPNTLLRLRRLVKPILEPSAEFDEDMFTYPLKVDPLAGVKHLESFAWTQIKSRVTELCSNRGGSVSTTGASSVKRGASHAVLGGASSSTVVDSDRDDNRYAILQSGDPVHDLKLLKPGMRVTRGRDWKWGDQDGGPGHTGVVTDIRSWNGHPNSCIRIRWDFDKSTNVYRYNVENAFDLALAPRTPTKRVKSSGKSSESPAFLRSTDDFRRALRRGDEIDAMDSFHRWYPATVRVVVPKKDSREGAARVAFHEFGPRYDEWIPLSSERLAPRKSRLAESAEGSGFAVGEVDDAADGVFRREALALGIFRIGPGGEQPPVRSAPAFSQQQQQQQEAVPSSSLTGTGEGEEEDGNDDDDDASSSVKELPSSTRVKCSKTGLVLHTGLLVQLKRPDDDNWLDGVVLQLGMKTSSSSSPTNGKEEGEASDQEMDSAMEEAVDQQEESKKDDETFILPQPHSSNATRALSTSSGSQILEKTPGTSFHALVKPIRARESDEEEEEEDDDDDDEDHAEWIDLDEVEVRLSSSTAAMRRRQSSSSSESNAGDKEASTVEELIRAGTKAFAKVGILNREAWVPITVISIDERDMVNVMTRFEDSNVPESTFAVERSFVVVSPPRGEYSTSARDLKQLFKAVRELEEAGALDIDPTGLLGRIFGRRGLGEIIGIASATLSSASSGRGSSAGIGASTAAAGAEEAASPDLDEDPLEDDVSRSPAPLSSPEPTPALSTMTAEERAAQARMERAKSLFTSSRSKTLIRDYSGIDVTAELASSSIHQTLTAAAALSTRLSLGWGDEPLLDDAALAEAQKQLFDSPVRLLSRRKMDETIHLCLARLSAKNDYQDISGITLIEYALDFKNANFNAFRRSIEVAASSAGKSLLSSTGDDMVEISGSVSVLPGKLYTVESNFPTICPQSVELDEPNSAWYYEVEIVLAGLAQIGWIDAECSCDDASGRGCGDDRHGWAFDGKRQAKWHVESFDWGRVWSDGDVLGVAVRIKEDNRCDVLFSLNGSFEKPMGLAFENVSFTGHLKPAITFNRTFSCRVNLSDFRFAPPDESFRSIASAMPFTVKSDAMSVEDGSSPSTSPLPTAFSTAGKKDEEEDEPEKAEEAEVEELTHEEVEPNEFLFDTIFDQADSLPPAAQVLRLLADLQLCSLQTLVNRRLTNKLVWQLQDALTVCSGALPLWCMGAVHEFPFLFPLETRQILFSSTALGVSRSLNRYAVEFEQEAQSGRGGSIALRIGAGLDAVAGSTGSQLKRQKVVLPRSRALESAIKLMQKFASQKCVLTMEFSEEIGHGLGPTLEFFSIVCRELQRKDLGIWRFEGNAVAHSSALKVETLSEDAPVDSYAFSPCGLFPAALMMSPGMSDVVRKRVLGLFRFLGRFIARAILDDRVLDLDLCPLFLDQVTGTRTSDEGDDDVEDLLEALAEVDEEFAKGLAKVYQLGIEYRRLLQLPESAERNRDIQSIADQVASLQVDGIVPGTDDVRLPGFSNDMETEVTAGNCVEYVRCVARFICFDGVRQQVEACREGLGQALDPESLRAFTTAELRDWLGGGSDRDGGWKSEEIMENIVLRDYTKDSPPIVNLVQVMCEMDADQRRLFLRFLTGAPRLPVGGWAALRPKMTVVKKSEVDVLPSCSTCAVVLKLPQYTSKEQLRDKLLLAIREGQSFFSMD